MPLPMPSEGSMGLHKYIFRCAGSYIALTNITLGPSGPYDVRATGEHQS